MITPCLRFLTKMEFPDILMSEWSVPWSISSLHSFRRSYSTFLSSTDMSGLIAISGLEAREWFVHHLGRSTSHHYTYPT